MGVRAARLRWSAAAAAALALALVPADVPALAATAGGDPAVQEAREHAERAREDAAEARRRLEAQEGALDAVAHDLDRAAEAYERSSEHHQRLTDEREGSVARKRAAEDATATARALFAGQVADLYRRAPLALRLSELVLAADSPATALHRADLIGRVSAGGAQRLATARRTAARASDDARQHEVVMLGSETAAVASRRRADELSLALQAAEQRVRAARRAHEQAASGAEQADAELETTVQDARLRLALERGQRISPEDLEGRGFRLPLVDGKVCPIGAPHGFSDSWHAPRSGGRRHLGVDMFAAHGMPLYAVTEGTVRVSNDRLGGLVVHLHAAEGGDRYYYAHLSAVAVSTGDRVEAGDIVGANGNSGNARSTPPHLHWQYHPGGGRAVNPYPLARALCR